MLNPLEKIFSSIEKKYEINIAAIIVRCKTLEGTREYFLTQKQSLTFIEKKMREKAAKEQDLLKKIELAYELFRINIAIDDTARILNTSLTLGNEIFSSPHPEEIAKQLYSIIKMDSDRQIGDLDRVFHDLFINHLALAQSISSMKLNPGMPTISSASITNIVGKNPEFKTVSDSIAQYYARHYEPIRELAPLCRDLVNLSDDVKQSPTAEAQQQIDNLLKTLEEEYAKLLKKNAELNALLAQARGKGEVLFAKNTLEKSSGELMANHNSTLFGRNRGSVSTRIVIENEINLNNIALKLMRTTRDIVQSDVPSKDYDSQNIASPGKGL